MAKDKEEAVQLIYLANDIMIRQYYCTFVMKVCYELVKRL